ncbi:MAG: ATP-dependent helicase [Ardenticatenales bacterium]|nr:ATP-dependent helicase [Ardenticatenales bacterium]
MMPAPPEPPPLPEPPTPRLRPAQVEILKYEGGLMAVSAVPGSGKTFTLTQLASQLIAQGRIDIGAQQEILIVTYLNASVDTFKARIRKQLLQMGLPPVGFDVRTLHSLGLEVMRHAGGVLDGDDNITVMDEVQSTYYLTQAVDVWIEANSRWWHQFIPEDSPQAKARWREVTEQTARTFIRTAKNERYRPPQILARLNEMDSQGQMYPLVWVLAGIYDQYQRTLERQGVYDFDDLIWLATEQLRRSEELAAHLRHRWPYVLEDEAQDSVPLQEVLLTALTGENGNWVRVGDPNQAITSTFTAAHPRFLMDFLDRPDVADRPLPNSGRSAPVIFAAANEIVHWVCDNHPVPEVRRYTFRRQNIQPTPPGDAQPNPEQIGEGITIRAYKHREDEELPSVAQLAVRYLEKYPDHNAAILVPTHNLGHQLAEHLDRLKAPYDNLLRGGVRTREIAAALHAMLALLANPLDTRALPNVHASLMEIGHPAAQSPGTNEADLRRFEAILRGVFRPEALIYPRNEAEMLTAVPANVARPEDIACLERLAAFLQRVFELRPLPIDDLVLALSDELFAETWMAEGARASHEADLALAYELSNVLRRWRDTQPNWRLPELAAQLEDVAKGRRALQLSVTREEGYEPEPGRITLCTQHASKGLEWDAVFLVSVDGVWIPGNLDGHFLGVVDFLGEEDPTAEASAQLLHLMEGDAGIYPDRTATESAHIDVISERLRLLYVGITRARRYLHISRSRATRRRGIDQPTEPATVMGVLYQFLQRRKKSRDFSGK